VLVDMEEGLKPATDSASDAFAGVVVAHLLGKIGSVGHVEDLRRSRMSIVGGLDVRHEALVFRMGV
jgi:hypothetical protein